MVCNLQIMPRVHTLPRSLGLTQPAIINFNIYILTILGRAITGLMKRSIKQSREVWEDVCYGMFV